MAQKQEEEVYHYFDKPDGQDIVKKLECVLKPTIPIAGGIALCDVLLYSYPKGYLATGLRFTAVSLPIIGITSTFVLATNGITNLRQKDDKLNWFLGGFITGSCFGLWKRNKMFGFNMGMLGGILAFCCKEARQQGWDLTPKDAKRRKGGATTCLHDYSLTADRPRNWTSGP